MMKVLLHVCCGPDVTVPLERRELTDQLSLFFFNPNIHPTEEYARRLAAFLKVACHYQAEYILGDYQPEDWTGLTQGYGDAREGGERCRICIGHRLDSTAVKAQELGFDAIGSVFTTSPLKNLQLVNELGQSAADRHGIRFIPADYKKKDGFKRSVQICKELDIYRQNYCGCRFSIR
ncbi:MAG: epoxyqueuosine reductase QueH [bacterium]|nr:epoxyqueuosine reductase QueH [bacterium]